MSKNNAFGGEKQNKKSNGEQSDLRDFEQVTLKLQLQVHHCLTTWPQIWYHSLLWGYSIRKGADLEKQNCLFGVHPAVMGKLTSLSRIKNCAFAKKSHYNYKCISTLVSINMRLKQNFEKAKTGSWKTKLFTPPWRFWFIDSMPRRIMQCIRKRGGQTSY